MAGAAPASPLLTIPRRRDAIIKSFSLQEDHFSVVREETRADHGEQIIFKVPRPGSQPPEWLGYIRWTGQDDHGRVELVNRRAGLQPSHLDIGGTSKFGDRSQAGTHGEGLKIALLVLQRGQQNHCVRCHSGSFQWNFDFTVKGRLVARLLRMSDKKLRQLRDESRLAFQDGSCPFAADPQCDVRFVIGQEATGRNEIGIRTPRNAVRRRDFTSWCKTALFLDSDARQQDIISGRDGALILDERLRGRIYLKGLLLQESTPQRSASITGKPLMFGYNFAAGWTNRDRQSMASMRDESKAILSTWDMALAVRPDLVAELSAMLNCQTTEYADVSGAELFIRRETALRLARHLLSTGQKWFFSSKEKAEVSGKQLRTWWRRLPSDQNPALPAIIDGLGLQGEELSDAYWALLASFRLVRTADQEQKRRFERAELCSTRPSAFASWCDHLLQACIRGCSYTRGVCVRFVHAGGLSLHTLYADSERGRFLLVHADWLDPERGRQRLGLPTNVVESDLLFHAVRQLFSDAIDQVPASCFDPEHVQSLASLRKWEKTRAEQRILEFLRLFREAHVSIRPSQIVIEHSVRLAPAPTYQLHRLSTCEALMQSLIASDGEPRSSDAHRPANLDIPFLQYPRCRIAVSAAR